MPVPFLVLTNAILVSSFSSNSSISKEMDFDNLNEISEEQANAPHTFSVSKNEFKQFIRGGGFAKDEKFVRIK